MLMGQTDKRGMHAYNISSPIRLIGSGELKIYKRSKRLLTAEMIHL